MSDTPTQNGYPVDLPSGGRYYKSGSSRVVLTHIKGEQEALLADASPQTFPEVMDIVLQQCSSDLPVDDWADLLIGDKYAMIFYFRQVSYPGVPYGFDVTCPGCDFPNAIDIDLKKDIDMRTGIEDSIEPFSVSLPMCGREATMRLMRVRDEREMTRFVRKERAKNPKKGDPGYLFSMAQGMVTLDDQPIDFDAAMEFVRGAAGMDTTALKDGIDDHDVGPELELEFTCQTCKRFWREMVPLGPDFFRPGSAKRRRAKG